MSPVPLGDERETGGEAAEPSSALPRTFEDADGRRIVLRAYADEDDAVDAMYAAFDPADRAQGLPPATESRRRAWLEDLLEGGLHVLAWHESRVVGHVALLPMDDARVELAVFVASGYQRATIGTHLLDAAFDYAREHGIERIWLTVERRNTPARRLYETTGFETVATGCEYEFEREL
ncbi:GNAT family N-acetyltransferase [Halarchaeum sp. P4]|uniref:GNAT family N-acetyltransferase n=1 Tax=Halarchaeum sp. P4 TaxID=3421639 RepID=UPI003EB93913